MTSLTMTLPDDWHIHLRDGSALAVTVPDIAAWAGRAIVMPNLTPPVRNVDDALAYRDRILAHVPPGQSFEPLMTLYLTDDTSASTIADAAASSSEGGISRVHPLSSRRRVPGQRRRTAASSCEPLLPGIL